MSDVLKVFILLLPLTATTKVFATLDFEDHAFPEFVTSARALAMGNAYINKVDDSWSAFYNPAGLGSVRQPQFHIANLHLEASSGLIKTMDDGPAYEMPGKYIESFDLEKMREKLAENQGKLAHSRFNFFPNFTVRGLTLGYLVSQRYRSIINDDAENKFEVAERKDQGPVMSLNGSLFGGVFKLGITGVYLSRTDLYKSFLPTDPTKINGNDYKKGSSLQLTAGARLTIPVEFLPTFSAVLRNTTANGFEDIRAGGAPEEIKQTWDAGFSITPQIGQSSRLHIEFNLKDVNNAYDTDYKRRAAMGVEIDFNRSVFLRAGSGDGWGSGGIGFRNRKFIFDLTTYAVDRSLDGFREEEDRRYVLSFASGI